jgi:hypothetical protein
MQLKQIYLATFEKRIFIRDVIVFKTELKRDSKRLRYPFIRELNVRV